MKNSQDRIVALDYFRGVCILIVLLSHSFLFSRPFGYLSGHNQLWTSAAEMFFLLSGITFAVVRGPKIRKDFKSVMHKGCKRALMLYGLYILLTFYAIVVGYYFNNHNWVFYSNNLLPSASGFSLLAQVMNFSYSLGWSDYLRFYCIYLMIASPALYVLKSRFWAILPLLSIFVFLMNASPATISSPHQIFAIWQLYFFIGMTLGTFRIQLIGWFCNLPKSLSTKIVCSLSAATAVALTASIFLGFNLYNTVNQLAAAGWLPTKARGAYYHLIQNQKVFNFWLGDGRFGVLRPIITLMVFATAYMLYQKYKKALLEYTGSFFNKMGSQTLWVYIAQAVTIPLIAALPLKYGNPLIDFLVTSLFLYGMWLVANRNSVRLRFQESITEFRDVFYEAKYNTIYNRENDL